MWRPGKFLDTFRTFKMLSYILTDIEVEFCAVHEDESSNCTNDSTRYRSRRSSLRDSSARIARELFSLAARKIRSDRG